MSYSAHTFCFMLSGTFRTVPVWKFGSQSCFTVIVQVAPGVTFRSFRTAGPCFLAVACCAVAASVIVSTRISLMLFMNLLSFLRQKCHLVHCRDPGHHFGIRPQRVERMLVDDMSSRRHQLLHVYDDRS